MPTFGKTGIGGNNYACSTGRIRGSRFTLSEDGEVTKISACMYAVSGTVSAKVGIYDVDGSNDPNNLVAVSEEVTGIDTTPNTWYDFPISAELSAGEYYLMMESSGDARWYADATGERHYSATRTYGDAWFDPFQLGGSSALEYSIYATYATGGATYTRTWQADVLFKKLGIKVGDEMKSVVGTSGAVYGTQCSFQRKSFYANGRFWVFYANSSNNVVYRTSADGLSWSDETVVRAGGDYGPNFSIFFDGTYVHYAANSTGSYPWDSALYYRRGTPNSNGTVTWSAAEQTVHTTYDKASNPAVAVDSNGYAWICYRELVNSSRCPYVIKSGNNDGTWGTTPTGFPYQLSATETSYWAAAPVPLTGGKMLVVYAHHFAGDYGEQVKMRAWSGSSWLDEVTTASGIYHSMHHSEVAEGDEAHIVFWKFTSAEDPLEVVHVKYSYGSNSLGSETTLQGGIPYTETYSNFSVPVIAAASGRLHVFWANYPVQGHIYYRKWNGSSWEGSVDWVDESSELFSCDSWTCFYQAYDGYVGVLYETKQSSPYNMKFACMPREVTVDALFKKLDIPKTADVDALLQKLDVLETFGADVAFLRQNVIKAFAVDASFSAVALQTISRQVDALFKKLDAARAFGADSAFKKPDITKNLTADAAFQKSLITQKQLDAFFKRLGILKGFAVDVRFGALMTQTMSRQIDALLKRQDAAKFFGLDVQFGSVEAETYSVTFGLGVIFAYRVRLPELWLDENGKLVLNISRPYTWVGT
jgi:hypothetical protein